MTKLWPYKIGAKIGNCSNAATMRTNVATFQRVQKHNILTSRRCYTTLRHSGLVLGRLIAHFEPIIVNFKDQTLRKRGERFWEVWIGGRHPRAWFSLGKKMD